MPERIVAADARRVVTVMFADLVGFTALSEHRDPEQVKRLVEEVFAQLVADIQSHGGVIDKLLGDAIVALFGAPVAHEDDADRAVRAGLSMQHTLRTFRATHPADAVRMRVGINTGEVLAGPVAGTEYTAMGDVVNTASRLQELALPGTVFVGQATRDLCSPAIRFERVDSVQLRGREQEITVWRALAVETATIVRRWSSDVEFVGRVAELGMMGAITSNVLAGRSAIAAIVGEAGIGKSRLVREAITPMLDARPDTLLLEGACAPYGESNVWWPVAGGLLARFGFDRNDGPESSRKKIIRTVASIDDYQPGSADFDRIVDLLMHLLGQPSALDSLGPSSIREAVISGIVQALRRRAQRAPVIVWVDDLQWAAPVLLELLETIARQLAGLPLLVVTTTRPGDGDVIGWPPPVDPALTTHLSLEALDTSSSAALVMKAAGRSLPDEVVADISIRSGGNPLFLIELARLAASTDDSATRELPGTLRALVAARLDQLTTTQRQVLDNAAILGNDGQLIALRQFAEELGQQFDPHDLDGIEAAGLLVGDAKRWQFRSDVVREVAYHTLTKQARAQRHAGVARYLAAFEPSLTDARAHHSAAAAELQAEIGPIADVPDDIANEAVELSVAAAKAWAEQGAQRRSLHLIERALAIGVSDPAVRKTIMLMRVEALVDLRDMRPARRRSLELATFADETDDRVLRGEAARLLGTIEQSEGDLVAARVHLGQAVDEFRDIGDHRLLAEALRARGFAEVFGGSLADADRFLREAEILFEEVDDERGTAWVHQHRAWVSFLSGDHDESEQRLWQAIDAFTDLEDRVGRTWSLGLLAYVYHFTRRDDEALALADEVLTIAKKWGDDWGSSMMLNLQASVWLWQGHIDEARSAGERALGGFRKIADRFGVIQALSTLNRAYVALGRSADADRSVEEVLALSDSFGELAYPVIAAAGTAMHLGRGERAAELASSAIGRLDTTGANIDEGRVIEAFGRLLSGDADGTLARLLDVDVERSPFALAARSTASAMLGDHAAALADVQSIESMESVSYWDLAVARVAAAGAAAAGVPADAAHRRSMLVQLVEELDDVVLSTYAADVLRRLDRPTDGHVEVERRDDERGVSIGGWSMLAAALVPG
ncbi:MAG: adenylate/guanylate cyclase domain-containing protein [Ilumatobacteraceae bacterium]